MTAPLDERGRQVQRVLWSVGEAHRLRRSRRQPATGQATARSDSSTWRGSRCELVTTRRGGHVYLSVVGDLDAASSRPFSEAVRALVDGGARSVVVDLGRAAVVEGPGLAALEAGRSAAQARHGELVLKSPRSATLALLERSGLSGAFPVS